MVMYKKLVLELAAGVNVVGIRPVYSTGRVGSLQFSARQFWKKLLALEGFAISYNTFKSRVSS